MCAEKSGRGLECWPSVGKGVAQHVFVCVHVFNFLKQKICTTITKMCTSSHESYMLSELTFGSTCDECLTIWDK